MTHKLCGSLSDDHNGYRVFIPKALSPCKKSFHMLNFFQILEKGKAPLNQNGISLIGNHFEKSFSVGTEYFNTERIFISLDMSLFFLKLGING